MEADLPLARNRPASPAPADSRPVGQPGRRAPEPWLAPQRGHQRPLGLVDVAQAARDVRRPIRDDDRPGADPDGNPRERRIHNVLTATAHPPPRPGLDPLAAWEHNLALARLVLEYRRDPQRRPEAVGVAD